MRRALQLASNGEGRVSPNPMVGAVIVNDNRIIGEGFHAFYGGPHAEVNAINSVKQSDRALLKASKMYVSLEPCAHHGKTPPCADLIINTGIPEVIIGSLDPNPLVAGKGVALLEKEGIKVKKGVLEKECKELNRRFMKAHSLNRPWIILKWAQSADGFLASIGSNGNACPVKFSSQISSIWMHRERVNVDAILVGYNTEKIEHPLLNVRYWGGNSPKKFVAHPHIVPKEFVENLRKEGITSLMVEGGAKILKSFIYDNLFDEIRVETSSKYLNKGLEAPTIPENTRLVESQFCGTNLIQVYERTDVKKA